jgi:hypothetical protein
MAPRTLASTWKQFEKLIHKYSQQNPPAKATVTAIDKLVARTNASKISDALASLFVHPYGDLSEVEVQFVGSDNQKYPDWASSYLEDHQTIFLNPVGILKFAKDCEAAAEKLTSLEARQSFTTYRFQAYLAEMRKLPSQMLLFMTVLTEVARVRDIAAVETKGGGVEHTEDENYINLLWAFKELEAFYKQNKGETLRLEYGIFWHESEWIVGK